jgi:hypothetical protein
MSASGTEFVMEGAQSTLPVRRRRRLGIGSAAGVWVRRLLTTTPGRLTLTSIVLAIGAVGAGVVAAGAELSRRNAAQAVRTQTEQLLVDAVGLYAWLSDANATVTTNFLTGGLEPPTQRTLYENDLRAASDSLARLTREAGGSPAARAAVVQIADQLPVYSGLVETARADNRQGFPVGAAYLRQATDLLQKKILPAADQLYATEAQRLNSDYASGTQAAALVVFFTVIALGFVLLVGVLVYLARISRRILNLPVLAASVVVGVILIWGLAGLISEQSALARAQRNGSDPVEVLAATRILASRAQSDESLTLVNRGTDSADPLDLKAVLPTLAKLVGEVGAVSQRIGTKGAAGQLTAAFADYQTEHAQIASLEKQGRIIDAIAYAEQVSAKGATPADRISANLDSQIAVAQHGFDTAARDATSSLSGLSLAVPLLIVLAAVLALLGLRQRINEYR